MKAFSVAKFDDKQWLLHTYEKLRHKKDMYGGSFFSVLMLVFFFFLMPLPESVTEKIIFWKLGIFVLFFCVTLGWYLHSTTYYKFCIKFLNYEHHEKRFPKKITYEVTKFSPAQIVLYLFLALIVPIVFSLFLSDKIDLSFFYWVFGVVAILSVFTFLIHIDDFYDQREKLDEIEILTEAFIYQDPLKVLAHDHEVLEVAEFEPDLEDVSFKKDEDSKGVNRNSY